MKKSIVVLIALMVMSSSVFCVGVTPFNWGIEHSGTISAAHALNSVMATGGSSQYIITASGGATTTYEAKWYRDNGSSLITTESVAENTLSNVKTKKVIFYAYPTTAISTPEIYIYGQ